MSNVMHQQVDKFKLYIVTNLVNEKRYVGITCATLSKRWCDHVYDAKTKNVTALHKAILKYGRDAFSIEHRASARTWADLAALEKIVIIQEGTLIDGGNGYNITKGGQGCHGRVASQETRQKIAQSWIGSRRGEKISAARRGKPGRKLSVQERQAIAERMRTRTISDETRAKLSASRAFVTLSPESIEKSRLSRIGNKHAAGGKSRMGQPHTEETKQKISKTKKEQHAAKLRQNDTEILKG